MHRAEVEALARLCCGNRARSSWGWDWFKEKALGSAHPDEFVQALTLFESVAEMEAQCTWMDRYGTFSDARVIDSAVKNNKHRLVVHR